MAKSGFGKILVAFDGSSDSMEAVRTAASLASEFGASLTVLHVYSLSPFAYAAPSPLPQVDLRALEDSAREKASAVLDRGVTAAKQGGLAARGELLEASSVVQAIVEFAASEKFDLIALGTRGITGFKKLLIGSVSSGVVSHAQCSVLVVR